MAEFTLDLSERFPHLSQAPIAEAVIHWQANAEKALEPSALEEELKRRFPEYDCRLQHGIEAAVTGSSDGMEVRQRTHWDGFRLESQAQDQPYVVQFKPNGIVFSRLAPYDKWETFEAEAIRFWEMFVELAEPSVIQRLGVRFINLIGIEDGDKPRRFLKGISAPPKGFELPVESFFHKDTFRVPGHAYQISWVRTLQPSQPQSADKSLIVDIDVSAENIVSLKAEELRVRLAEMRTLKDKVFFSCMTEFALKRFRKS